MRKLLWIACGYAGALLLAHYLLPQTLLLYAAGLTGVLCMLAAAVKRLRGRVLPVLLAAALGFGWYYAYDALFVRPADAFSGERRTVSVCVSAYPNCYDDYSSVLVRSVDGTVPHVRMLVYDYSAGMQDLRPGDLVEMPLKLTSAAQRYREKSDYYLSDGILLRGWLTEDYSVTGRSALRALFFPHEIARVLKRQVDLCFPEDTAPLMKALLTGDRRDYYEDDALVCAMKMSGFSHIVAVSGMHTSFLVGALGLLIRRRRRRAAVGIPMIVVFMAMVGFTPSVVRAGIMQIMLLTAPLLRRENDPPTSLAAAALVLLGVNPAAIGSISLQLSFCAMAGLLTVTPRLYARMTKTPRGKDRFEGRVYARAMHAVCTSVSASVGAIVFTTPVAAFWFGMVPVYSVLTNLLCLWAMSAAFTLGYPVCILGMLWQPLGSVCGWAVAWLARYSIALVKLIARLPWSVICTRGNLGAWWLVFVYAVFILSFLFKGRERWRPVVPLCLSVAALALVSMLSFRAPQGSAELSALDVGQGQSIVLLTHSGAAVIDCGGIMTPDNAGDTAADFLLSSGRRSVDLLVLTHFHEDHANGVERLLNRMEVRRLAYPADYEQSELSDTILSLCASRGVALFPIAADADVTIDDLALRLIAPLGSRSLNERGMLVYGSGGSEDFLVTGDAGVGVESLFCRDYDPEDTEILIAGHHGSRSSTGEQLLDTLKPHTALISVGAANSYDHPAPEVLERLTQRGINILRTDTMGTISLSVGN